MEQAGGPGERAQAAGVLEQGRARAAWRVGEPHVPVHARAERLVAGLPAPAQRVVLGGGAVGAGNRSGAGERDPPGHPVRAVGRDLDGGSRDGRTLQQRWDDDGGSSALHGTTVAGFPNLFLLVGPNTGLGHSSIIFMIESQLSYILDALHTMEQRRATTIEPRAAVQQAYDMEIQHQLAGTVWNQGGCSSWYFDEHGRNTSLWPTFTFRFRQLLRRFDPTDYELGHAPGDDTGLGSSRELSAAG